MTEDPDPDAEGTARLWLVERTFSDDEQNIVILIYATPDGMRYRRKERALTSFTGSRRSTTAAIEAPVDDLGSVDDDETRRRYAEEARRMAAEHEPGDEV